MPSKRVWQLITAAAFGGMAMTAFPSAAQSAAAQERMPHSDMARQADRLFALFNGKAEPEDLFAPAFLAAIPAQQVRAIAADLRKQYGAPLHIASLDRQGANQADLVIAYERADVTMRLTVDRAAPHAIVGLLITGAEVAGDSLEGIAAELASLPGSAGMAIATLRDGDASFVDGLQPETRFAIASVMKLYILAELDRQIRQGARHWSDVVSLGPRSHPSGVMQDWPEGDPVTLATLATLMISRSDNTATDTLVRVLGQDALAAMVERSGHAHPEWLSPFLMTQQATAMKMPSNTALRGRFKAAKSEKEQARIIEEGSARLTLTHVDFSRLLGKPLHIDTAQWFATPADLVALLAWMDVNMSDEARRILAINPGIGPGDAARWSYLGYKGGSEAGVLAYTFLAQARSGQRYAVAITWNNPSQPIEEARLLTLAARTLNYLADQ